MNGTSDNAWWMRVVLAALLSALLTGIGAWLVLGQNVVHTSDLQGALDRSNGIEQAQTSLQIQQMSQDIRDLTAGQSQLRTALISNSIQIEKLQTQIAFLIRKK